MLSTWTDACCPEGAVRGLASKVPLARGPRQPPGGWGRLYLVRGKRRRRGWSVPGLSWPAAGGRRLEGPWVRPRLGGGHWPLQARRGEDRSIHCPNLLNRSEHLQVNITSLSLSLAFQGHDFVALVKIMQSCTLLSNHAAPHTD